MDIPRCTSCRNPIKSHHARRQHPRTGGLFHEDCWASEQGALQQDYLRRIGENGLEGLLAPYVCGSLAEPSLPEQRADEYAVPAEEDVPGDVPVVVAVPAQAGGPVAVLEDEVV